jgi:hypothetical protein
MIAPNLTRLMLNYDESLSNFASNVRLRRYTKEVRFPGQDSAAAATTSRPATPATELAAPTATPATPANDAQVNALLGGAVQARLDVLGGA